MPRQYSHDLQTWVDSNPKVKTWFDKKALGSKNTASVYGSSLFRYWRDVLSSRFGTVDKWIDSIKGQQKSDEVEVQRQWGSDLQGYIHTTNLMEGSRFVLVQAVKSFLKEYLNIADYSFTIVTKDQHLAEKKHQQEQNPLSLEEIRTLVNDASTRDRAIILTQVSAGLGVGEFLQFAREWKKYVNAIREKKVPIKIDIVRPKTGVDYHTYLWDDAVQAVHDLLMERARQWGPNPDYLFVNQFGKPIVEDDIQTAVRNLADRTGLEPTRGPGTPHLGSKPVYRIRPHNFRDYFKTACENSEVPDTISEFCLGHEIDELGYNQFQKTDEGKERIVKALGKVRPKLNILTQRGQALLKDHEEEIIAKASKMTYKNLIEQGVFPPEKLTTDVLKIIAKAVGTTFEKLVLMADVDTLLLPEEVRTRLGLFDLVSHAIDLDMETYHRYAEALKVMKPTEAKFAWENTDNYWMRVEVGTDEYMQALADHFVVEDKEGKMRILRKPKNHN